MIKVDVQDLLQILNYTPADQNIMLVGRHGIGKSQIIKEFYSNKKNMKVVPFFLGQMSDPGDLIGLMHKNSKTGHSEFLPPYWWPSDNKPIVLFLDELNRSRPEILQSVMDLTLNKTLAGKKLPPDSIIISAINEGDEYQLTDLDPSLISRFNIYEFVPTVEDWLLWATKNSLDERIINFIQKSPGFLDTASEQEYFSHVLNKAADRRAWHKASDMIKPIKDIQNIHIKIMAGIVGVSAALNFKKSLETTLKISVEQLLLSKFQENENKLNSFILQDFIFMNEQIMYWLNNTNNYKQEHKTMILENLHSYLVYLKKKKFPEAAAHLASMLENPRFSKVTSFVLVESASIMNELVDYIQNIEL